MKNNLKLMDEIKIKILFFKIVKKKKKVSWPTGLGARVLTQAMILIIIFDLSLAGSFG
jgi:hypothetical protein